MDTSISQIFIARQPILDRKGQTYAYELLYRETPENRFILVELDEDLASRYVLVHSFLHFGLNRIAFGRRVFINFTANLLRSRVLYSFPPEKLVVELLENIEVSDSLLTVVREVREKGYYIALDDYREDSALRVFLPYADFVKIDFRDTPPEEIERLVRELGETHRLVAEKVETREEFEWAVSLGFRYFQGFYFARPQVLSSREMPVSKFHYFRLLKFLYGVGDQLEEIVQIISSDAVLSLRLLKFINSAFFGLLAKVKSVKHAAVLLGIQGLKKWASLITLHILAADRPPELVINSLVRARFMELLAERLSLREDGEEAFTVGLLSLLEAMLDQPMEEIVKDLPLEDSIKEALLDRPGPFTPLLRMVVAYERGEWAALQEEARRVGLFDDSVLPRLYSEALTFAHRVMSTGL
ncbi:MAG TPA: HDOD domain-containing protein [Thermosulfurimonas dismutans]|uniref:HDOD domain-containing protein n=1 Tax=Thermosulfurimonas dismutans TaxID=999894 RepID=A0A7C3GJM5_9BACT|nr:HDOD domain-containing protein [Thermosulfurimonas dismutans]